MFMPEKLTEVSESQLRVAFDGDAVLFSDESERIFKAHGLDKFFEHERENEDTLLDHVCTVVFTGGLFGHSSTVANVLSPSFTVNNHRWNQYRLHFTLSQNGCGLFVVICN